MEDIGLWSKPGASQATRAYNRNSICLEAHGNMHGSVSSPQDEGCSFPNELQSEVIFTPLNSQFMPFRTMSESP